jgi:hypothetical protein
MARTVIAPVALTLDAGTDVKSATVSTAIDQANGMFFASDGRTSRYLLHVKNTHAGANIVTIKAPVDALPYPAFRSGLGDLAVNIASTTGEQMIVVDSARFMQDGGNVNVDFDAATAGSVVVYKLPASL